MNVANGTAEDLKLVDLRAAQLEARDVFRAMVDALARPGTTVLLPSIPSVAPVVVPVLALADLHTTLAVVGDPESRLPELLHRVTDAPSSEWSDADLAVSVQPTGLTSQLVDALRVGSAEAPELGARLFAAVTHLGTAEGPPDASTVTLTVTGPGTADGRTLRVGGMAPEALRALDRRNEAYPAGIDTWLVDSGGRMVALPRSSTLAVCTSDPEGDR